MTLITSSHFVSADAAGRDWREAVKSVLDQLEEVLAEDGSEYTFGFLYISDLLREDASSILNLLKSVTHIDNWIGSTGIGVCTNGREYLDEPALSLMLAKMPADLFRVFQKESLDSKSDDPELISWLENNDVMLAVVHGNPDSDSDLDPVTALEQIHNKTGAFTVGGTSSSRGQNLLIANNIASSEACGVIFSASVPVATTLTQGCLPMGPVHTITRTEGANGIIELDNQRAMEVLANDLKQMAQEKTGHEAEDIIIDETSLEDPEKAPEDFRCLFQGQVHVAFPISGSDQRDYIVRNIVGVDPHFGHLRVAHPVSSGDQILFVHRDNETIRADLSRTLVNLRKRIVSERGEFAPKGALFISCLARAYSGMEEMPLEEMKLVREIIGEIPLAGFYASGEISNSRLYSYTGILTLFF